MAKRMIKNPRLVFSFFLISAVIFVALASPIIAPNDPTLIDISQKFLEPTPKYPLGTDQFGRCVLSMLIYGARYSVGLAIPTLLILAFIGTALGMLGAGLGGIFDKILITVCNIFMAFPPLVIVLTFINVLGQGILNLLLSVILSMWVWFVKVIRSYVLEEKNKGYVTAAKISGCRDVEIMTEHILPNIAPLLITYFSTGVASIILMISGYSFLGLGLGADTPEWGAMLSNAKQYLYSKPMLIVYPGICILLTSAGFNLFGEALRYILSPKEGYDAHG